MNNYNFGNFICDLRTKKKLSQSELATILGVTNKAVSKWENGAAYPSSELIYPLAKALDVSVEELYRVMSGSKKTKNRVRRFLDKLFSNKTLSLIIPIAIAVILYVIFLIFGEGPDKGSLAVLAPIASLIAFWGVFFIVFIQIKNPMCKSWFIDLLEIFFLVSVGLMTLTLLVDFLSDVKNGFTFSLLMGFTVWSAISFAHNKRRD